MIKTIVRLGRLVPLVAAGLLATNAADAASFLSDWPQGAEPQVVGRRVTERFLSKDYRLLGKEPNRAIHYVETCTWYGALNYAQLVGDKALTEKLVRRFDPLFGEKARLIPPPLNVDYAVFGAVPFELYLQTKDQRFLKLGLSLADAQWTTPANAELSPEAREGIAAGLSWHTRFWIDDMYMITMLQTQAYRATGDAKYLDRAAREAVAYLQKLQQPTGLFYHAPDSPFFWGRGNGWFAAGMSELLRSLPKDHALREPILVGYRKMMATLLKHQGADGMWRQLIDDPESWPESSSTGMFTFAFISGVKNGWLDESTYGPAARKGWLALVQSLEPNADIRNVCEGTNKGFDRPYYLARGRITGDLHGQAPVLWSAVALMR